MRSSARESKLEGTDDEDAWVEGDDERGKPIDMSPQAIARRFEEVRALYKLWLSLRTIRFEDARPVNPTSNR